MAQCSMGGKLAQRFVSPLGQIDPNDTNAAVIYSNTPLRLLLHRGLRGIERDFASTGFTTPVSGSASSAIAGSRSQKLSAGWGADAIAGNSTLPEAFALCSAEPTKVVAGQILLGGYPWLTSKILRILAGS
jgi:hypothetical protein